MEEESSGGLSDQEVLKSLQDRVSSFLNFYFTMCTNLYE